MKHKKRSVCNNCRRRKLGCDGKKPGCTQCLLSGYSCNGYSTALTFIQQGSHQPKRQRAIMHSTRRDNSSCSTAPRVFRMPPQMTQHSPGLNHLLTVIVEHYLPENEKNVVPLAADRLTPRICGTWVEVLYDLPCLIDRHSLISKAVLALASAVLASVNAGQSFFEQYRVAIRSLRQTLEKGEGTVHELLPAIMCLVLVEVMIPNANTALDAHLNAVGRLFQSCGPEACKASLLHRLFIGYRPLMITHTLKTRQPTFLSHPAWIEVPFAEITPSIMQNFLSDFVPLSSLLRQRDCLSIDSHLYESEYSQHLASLKETRTRLDEWESFLGNSSRCFWNHKLSNRNIPNIDDHQLIYYPNVTMANLYTHLWAFKIVCLRELATLTLPQSETWPCQPGIYTSESCPIALARRIYLSMDFLLQEDMRLFGPASSSFPLWVAWGTLKGNGNAFDRSYIESIIDRLVHRGLLSASELMLDS